MQYVFEIRTTDGKKQTFRIDASGDSEAIERLKLRLPPDRRDSVIIDSIQIDMSTVGNSDPYGLFGGE